MDATAINDVKNVKIIAEILQVHERALNDALTKKTIFAQGERVVSSNCKINLIKIINNNSVTYFNISGQQYVEGTSN